MDNTAALRRGLLMLFWGAILVIVDLTIRGLDIVPDAVGWVLAAVGLAMARRVVADPRYESRVTAALLFAWVGALLAICDLAGLDSRILGAFYIVVLVVQPIMTAYALRRLAVVARSPDLVRTWTGVINALWAELVVVVPFAIGVIASGGAGALVVVPVLLFVLWVTVYYLVAVMRTRRDLVLGQDGVSTSPAR